MKKKTLSLFLAFVLIVACMPVSARATASNDYTQWKQYDSEWNQSEAGPASQYPNATYRWMKEAGCYVTTIAILLRHYNVVSDGDVNHFNPWICNTALGNVGALNSAADMVPANISKAYPGFVYQGSVGYSASQLVSLYNQGYACVVAVNGYGHYVAVRSATDTGNIVIMDPGASSSSLSRYGSINAIIYFSATPQEHTCNMNEFAYNEAAHPHYKCYKCSICGKVQRNTNEPTLLNTCDACRPGKPELQNMQETYPENKEITFAWNNTDRTTHYNLWLDKLNENNEWETVEQIFYAKSGLTRELQPGHYRAQLLSYNSDLYEPDGSDWYHTWSNDCYFL